MFIGKITNNFPVKGGKIKVERLCVLRKWEHEDYYNVVFVGFLKITESNGKANLLYISFN